MDLKERHAAQAGKVPPISSGEVERTKFRLSHMGITSQQIMEADTLIEQGDRSSYFIIALKYLFDFQIKNACTIIHRLDNMPKKKLKPGVKKGKERKKIPSPELAKIIRKRKKKKKMKYVN